MTPPITILPAIDLKGGRCVRLRQGVASDETVYGDDPVAMARRWADEGAEYLHVVDLDGAFQGHPVHAEAIAAVAGAIPIPVEVGGGLRTDADIERLLAAGVARVILGTRALGEADTLRRLAAQYGERLAVGIDAREGRVQVRGWTETTDALAVDLARRVADAGVATIIYTETSRDGMLAGVHVESLDAVCAAAGCAVIASGGVSSAADVAALRRLGRSNLVGAIVGKALYEGTVTLAGLRAAADGAGGAPA